MPDTPPVQESRCSQCGTPVPESLLRRLGGTCSACLYRFAAANDEPEFPNLELLSTLGRGGMGVVYKARQPRLNRIVAVKVLSPQLMDEPHFRERFEREAAAMALLAHPNIVVIYDSGVHGGIPYLLMEYVEGRSLRARLKDGPVEPGKALGIAAALCDALAYAHERGVIHRDLKPENILIDAQGCAKLADFGLARLARDESTPITLAGERLGTPTYMSPEQIERSPSIDHRSDLYSLGVVLYEMLTGELPIGRFKPPSKVARVDPRVDRIVLGLLEKKPQARPASAAAVKGEIERLRSKRSRRRTWAFAGLVLAAVGIAIGMSSRNPDPAATPPVPTPAGTWEELGGSASNGVNLTPGPTYRPSVCLDRSGRPVVAWGDESSGNAEIYLRRWDGQAWVELGGSASGGGISRTPGASKAPCLALDSKDRPVVTWFEETGGDLEIYLRRWDGAAWVELDGSGSGGGLSRSASHSGHPVVAVDPAGVLVVSWYCIPRVGTLSLGQREIYLKRWDGSRWTELGGSATGGGISRNRGQSYMPSIALDRAGYPTVVWHDDTAGNSEIYLRRWDGTAWVELDGSATGGGISRNAGVSATSLLSNVQLDPQGNPIVVWDDDTSGNKEIYLRKWNGQAWEELGGSASGGGISCTPSPSVHPSVVLTPSGRPVVCWQEDVPSRIFLRTWDGREWVPLGESASGTGTSLSRGSAIDPVLALDLDGRPVVVWNDWRPSKPPQICLRRWNGPVSK